MSALVLTGADLTPADVAAVARDDREIAIGVDAAARLVASRAVVERHLAQGRPVYGLTTGLGSRAGERVSDEALAELSKITVLGRGNAVGPRLPADAVRAVMVVRLNGLLVGGAGASPALAEMLAALLNGGLHPVVPAIGSIGAADLCVLAHLGLAMIGDGEIVLANETLPAAIALDRAGLAPLVLAPKDGIAICSAAAYSVGLACLMLVDADALRRTAQVAAALTMEGFRANLSPLDPRAAAARPAPGQVAAAAELRALLVGGALNEPGAARRLQDPISLRAVAPVHGAAAAAADFLRPALAAELNGAGDNPLVLPDDGEILSTGNFHTPALTLALETLGQAMAHVAALSVSRVGRLLEARLSGLPRNLSRRGPSRSGFAPLTKTAEALLQEIRHAALPAPMELRFAAEGVEDDLTNAPFVARKAGEILWRLRLVLAIELIVAAQAIDLAGVDRLGHGTAAAHKLVRDLVAPLDDDRPSGPDVERLADAALTSGALLRATDRALGA